MLMWSKKPTCQLSSLALNYENQYVFIQIFNPHFTFRSENLKNAFLVHIIYLDEGTY